MAVTDEQRFLKGLSTTNLKMDLTGAAPTAGTATLVGGTVVVATTAITANSRIMLTRNTPGGTVGDLSAPSASRVVGTSFVINSDSGTDTSTVDWMVIG